MLLGSPHKLTMEIDFCPERSVASTAGAQRNDHPGPRGAVDPAMRSPQSLPVGHLLHAGGNERDRDRELIRLIDEIVWSAPMRARGASGTSRGTRATRSAGAVSESS